MLSQIPGALRGFAVVQCPLLLTSLELEVAQMLPASTVFLQRALKPKEGDANFVIKSWGGSGSHLGSATGFLCHPQVNSGDKMLLSLSG